MSITSEQNIKIRTGTITCPSEGFIQWEKTPKQTNEFSWIKVRHSEYNQRKIIKELTI